MRGLALLLTVCGQLLLAGLEPSVAVAPAFATFLGAGLILART